MSSISPEILGPVLNLKRLPHGVGLDLPAYETAGAAGMDLRAAVGDDEPMVLAPGARALVPTGARRMGASPHANGGIAPALPSRAASPASTRPAPSTATIAAR